MQADGEAGFTLFELMIAAGIMLTAMVLMFGSLIRISASTGATEQRAIAATQLASIVEEVQSLDLESLRTYQPPPLADLGAMQTVAVSAIDGNGAEIAVPATETQFDVALPNPLEVQITITWRDANGRTYTREASTLVRR
jgi:Tfp pilus assembly protein PilV